MKHIDWVKGFVRRITAKWKAAPPVHVVESWFNLPQPTAWGVRGLYKGGEAFITSDQGMGTVAQTVTHEVIGHHGMRAALGARWKRFMTALHDGAQRRRGGKLGKLRDYVRQVYTDRRGRCELEQPWRFADEMAARAVEQGTDPWTADYRPPRSRIRTRFADVMRALRRPRHVRLRFGHPELVAVIKAAAKKLRDGTARLVRRRRSGPHGMKRPWRMKWSAKAR